MSRHSSDNTTARAEPRATLPPELLVAIFDDDCLIGRDRAAASQVCRAWTDLALDALYRVVTDVVRVMGALGPMDRNTGVRSVLFCLVAPCLYEVPAALPQRLATRRLHPFSSERAARKALGY